MKFLRASRRTRARGGGRVGPREPPPRRPQGPRSDRQAARHLHCLQRGASHEGPPRISAGPRDRPRPRAREKAGRALPKPGRPPARRGHRRERRNPEPGTWRSSPSTGARRRRGLLPAYLEAHNGLHRVQGLPRRAFGEPTAPGVRIGVGGRTTRSTSTSRAAEENSNPGCANAGGIAGALELVRAGQGDLYAATASGSTR